MTSLPQTQNEPSQQRLPHPSNSPLQPEELTQPKATSEANQSKRSRPKDNNTQRHWFVAAAIITGGAIASWLMAGTGFANYDVAYSLLWGKELGNGGLPSYQVPLAPTPHPLSTLFALVLSPLGDGGEVAWVIVGFICLGALAWVTFELGRAWFGVAAGALAAIIILTREPVLSYGARAYIDIPYVVLVLAALLWETKRRRAGTPVLMLLAIAGLLRPEAWLFAGAYVLYLFFSGERRRSVLLKSVVLAALGPALWLISDLALAGDALYSLTGTQQNAATLHRKTGLPNVVLVAPRRIGEILREPVLLGALFGSIATLICAPRRLRAPLAAGILALAAFSILAVANLPILGRYLLAPATLIAIVCGAGVFGWTVLKKETPWRRRWQLMSVVPIIALIAFTPRQFERIRSLNATLSTQKQIHDDLRKIALSKPVKKIGSSPAPIAVPNHRPIPYLALWLNRSPKEIHSAQLIQPSRGLYFDPASAEIAENFMLDKNDPKRLTAKVPQRFKEITRNRSWVVFSGGS